MRFHIYPSRGAASDDVGATVRPDGGVDERRRVSVHRILMCRGEPVPRRELGSGYQEPAMPLTVNEPIVI